MNFHILTLFPEMVEHGLCTSILGKAAEAGHIRLETVNIRDYTSDKHNKVDDYPYGGGAGMLMQAQPVFDAYRAVAGRIAERDAKDEDSAANTETAAKKTRVIFLTPQGQTFCQELAEELSREEDLIFLCGHYEGIDERVLEEIVTDEVSIGDYVLTGGELAAMVMIDAIARLVPGVLHNEESACTESFQGDLLEYPQYSRPEVWHDKRVPEVLLSGDHKRIAAWRLEKARERTKAKRPDLYEKYQTAQDAIAMMTKRKLVHMDMIEAIRLGYGKLLYFGADGVLLWDKRSRAHMLSCESAEAGQRILLKLSPKERKRMELLVLHSTNPFEEAGAEQEYGLFLSNECIQAVYTRGVSLPVRKNLVIRQLDLSYEEIIREHYSLISEPEFIRERIRAGVMYGAFVQKQAKTCGNKGNEENLNAVDDRANEDKESGLTLAGFIGEHEEGSMGMLEVFSEFRRQGIAEALESFCINRMLREGRIPFCQIIKGNEASVRLQEKLGLRISGESIWWMHRA